MGPGGEGGEEVAHAHGQPDGREDAKEEVKVRDADRIKDLEARLAAAEARIAQLEARPLPLVITPQPSVPSPVPYSPFTIWASN